MNVVEALILLPVAVGSIFHLIAAVTAFSFLRRERDAGGEPFTPPISVLKPVYGLERNLEANLRSACLQDYPAYQVVCSVQRLDDPALPLLRRLEEEYGPERVRIVAVQGEPVVNGKVQNLENALSAAQHRILVISDSDVFTPPDYLKRIVAPLRDPGVGFACTLYKGADARSMVERLELLTYNAQFIPSAIFAYVTGTGSPTLGATIALRRETLEAIGGLGSLADYLVEDYEMGRRIVARGQRMALVPYFVDLTIDLQGWGAWWRHQVYWDQNIRAARPAGFAASVLTHAVPFALLFAGLRAFDALGLAVLTGALAVRLGTAATTSVLFKDIAGLRALWLLPARDLAGLASWCAALIKRRFTWRGHEFELTGGGRIVPRST